MADVATTARYAPLIALNKVVQSWCARSAASAAITASLLLTVGFASRYGHAASAASTESNAAAEKARAELTCAVSLSCVNSLDSGGLTPLRFEGTPEEAVAALRTTLAEFLEAKILTANDRSVEAVFTTDRGFRDLVDFKIDTMAQRIDFRSHSSFGRNDFGKNRERMTAFSTRFQENTKR